MKEVYYSPHISFLVVVIGGAFKPHISAGGKVVTSLTEDQWSLFHRSSMPLDGVQRQKRVSGSDTPITKPKEHHTAKPDPCQLW